MAVHLRIISLTVTTAEAEQTYRFDRPATVITGPIGTGKSSLLMLVKHALGGSAMLTPAVREHVLSVHAEVVAGDEHVVLRRTIEGDTADTVDLLDPRSLTLERSLPVRASEGATTLSDYLLDALGFPREQIAARREGAARPQNLTFNDLYAYVYLQAREIDRQVVGHLDRWFEVKRKELFRLMFGLTDSALMELKRTRNQLSERLTARDAEHSSGTPSCGAVRTMSAWAPPLPGAFHVPVAGSDTSVQYEAIVPIPSGASTAAWAAAWTCGRSTASLAMFGFGRSIAITVSLTAIGWEAPLEPAPRAVEPISVTGRRSS
ncbi:ATP-binding protein [Streptomyces luteogriseus]|uniref:ATP-binding protein n=1 Tax=Streptomyces luteogriseus TaxID=68233 RepID=UPI0033EFD5DD